MPRHCSPKSGSISRERRAKTPLKHRSTRDRVRARVQAADVRQLGEDVFGDSLHATRVVSLSTATTGVIPAAARGVKASGRALALSQGALAKDGIKQVGRLLSNTALKPADLFAD